MITEVTWLFTTALYHVTSCDRSQLTQYLSMATRMQPERRRKMIAFIAFIGVKAISVKKKKKSSLPPTSSTVSLW
ncbi:unnamed protein product [Staurois parvus]|uniref:Uncharacterized protein n=1 Tax=Staurois parvus TaxID=386267 RepID=A0ABN9C013_9NEOB|nr:unnamed protein product [Staurois parvus]